jgi:hypothetical protein
MQPLEECKDAVGEPQLLLPEGQEAAPVVQIGEFIG